MLLINLCNAFGPSGCEGEIRDILMPIITPLCDKVEVDNIGNLIAYKKGTEGKRTTMLCAHMDEVSLIIKEITADGYIKFDAVGGIDPRVLISKGVMTQKNRLSGVIGAKPKHLMSKSETGADKISNLYIDIGAKDKAEAEKYVSLGEYVAFDTKAVMLPNNGIAAKALDDRAGCYVLCELMKNTYKDNIYFVFNVQEEVGLRGARVSSHNINPDRAIVLEGTTCADLVADKDYEFSTKSGEGVAISIYDKGSRADREMACDLKQTAIDNNIPWQFKQTTMGGNDAGAIHIARGGIKTAVLSVPCRYIHSPISVASLDDIRACIDITDAYLKRD
ncbi:MAG: M42 family metallopeptidase [Eubacteriales bacterium]|nr:M42 family metallopeptidase [Eubacteriales bacterium]